METHQAGFNVVQGRVVLFKTDPDKYLVALIIKVNEDHTVDLTLFKPAGDTGLASHVKQGNQIGDWCPPGVDAVKQEQIKSVHNPAHLQTGSVEPKK